MLLILESSLRDKSEQLVKKTNQRARVIGYPYEVKCTQWSLENLYSTQKS